jgi:glyceraldehyde 3-phosphate dehydrogenase
MVKVMKENFGWSHGIMTTIHSYTMSQRILDGSHKDLRRGRAAAISMIPTTTGAAKAVTMVMPELKGKLDGLAVRVPTPDGSIIDLTVEVGRDTTVEEVNAAFKKACEGPLNGVLGYSDEPLVSIDYIGDTHGGVFDSLLTYVIDKRMVKIFGWYDNEAGFTNQYLRLVKKVAAGMK